MKVIDVKNVHKIYNESEVHVHAVNGIDLEFEQGETHIMALAFTKPQMAVKTGNQQDCHLNKLILMQH